MLNMVGKAVIKEKKLENRELIEIFKNGGNFIKEENLDPIIDYIKEKN